MPPRTLPWLAQPKSKPQDHFSTSSPAPPKRAKTPASDEDLVDPDLNPTNADPTPPRRRKQPLFKQTSRSPSSSPPPAPPDVVYMRAGTDADDAWMMVEDELFATASLYTRHLHVAAYAEQKRRAEARGRQVLRTLERPTDGGRTERDALVVEREGREKAIREALGKDSEEEDGEEGEELTDPLLGALMNDPKRMGRALQGVGRVKSDSRAAKGFLRSPEKARKTFGGGAVQSCKRVEDEGGSEAESDDLDGPAQKSGQRSAMPPPNRSDDICSRDGMRRETSLFKRFTAASGESTGSGRDRSSAEEPAKGERSDQGSLKATSSTYGSSFKDDKMTSKNSNDDQNIFKRKARDEGQSYLAKRKQRKEEEAKRKANEKKPSVEVPTFLF